MSRLRVLHVIDSLGRGGAERHLVQVVQFLAKRGVDQVVAQLFRQDDLANAIEHAGVRVMKLGLEPKVSALRLAPSRLYAVASRSRPHLIATQLVYSDIAGRTVARAMNIPSLTTWQNTTYDPHNPLMRRLRTRLAYELFRTLDSATVGWAAGLVAVSETVQHSYVRALGIGPMPVSVVPNSIDLSRFDCPPTRRPFSVGTLRLVHVGRHVPQKGLPILLDALSRVPSTIDVTVDLFGAGPDGPELVSRARRLGVQQRVAFRGPVSDVVPHLMAADAFVFPSLHEGLALALLEAYAAGLPVLASAIEPNLEIDTQRVATLSHPAGDAAALARHIEHLALDQGERVRLAAAAPAVVRRFSVENVGEQLLTLFDTAARARAGLPNLQ
jgi:glycosyltransferase involved in cell wall biosynthesis